MPLQDLVDEGLAADEGGAVDPRVVRVDADGADELLQERNRLVSARVNAIENVAIQRRTTR